MSQETLVLQDRLQVAQLLAEKFLAYKNSNAVVVAVPRGGVPIGFALADLLNISFDIIPCKKIKHPAHGSKSIGSVSIDELVVNEGLRNIPQDYIYHQMILLQHTLRSKSMYYKGDRENISLTNRNVILVDDLIQSGDTIMACIKSIKSQYPTKIILTAAAATPEAMQMLSKEVDDFVPMQVERSNNLHAIFPPVTDEEVRNIISRN
jgi:putative phosphoribosyl transferase